MYKSSGQDGINSLRTNTLVIAVFFLLIGFAVYGNSIRNPFIWDDFSLIERNYLIKDPASIGKLFLTDLDFFGSAKQGNRINYYRPMVAVSFMVDFHLWGLKSFGYHITNILVHITNALFIVFLCRMLLHDKKAGFFAGLIFLIHPINTEAVTYISGRGDPLSLCFILLSFIFLIRHTNRHKTIFSFSSLLSAIFFLGALFTRENNIVSIIVFFIYLFLRQRDIPRKNGYLAILIPHIAVLVFFLTFRLLILKISRVAGAMEDPLWVRLIALPQIIFQYLRILILPYDLRMARGFSPVRTVLSEAFYIPFIAVVTFFIFVVKSLSKNKFLWLAFLWFVVQFLPFSSIITPLTTYVAEHWFYIPFLGIALLLGKHADDLLAKIRYHRLKAFFFAAGITAIFSIYGAVTFMQNQNWSSEERFYEREYRFSKGDCRIAANLASCKIGKGEYDRAIEIIKAVLEIHRERFAMLERMYGGHLFGIMYKILGDAYFGKGDFEIAADCYKKAIDIDSDFGEPYNDLANCYLRLGREEDAIEFFKKSAGLNPYLWQPYANLGSIYLSRGEYVEAKRWWEKVLQLRQGFKDAVEAIDMIERNDK